MKERISVKPKIVDLQSTNDIYMTMSICILSNQENYNNALFTDDYLDGIIENKDDYIGIPFLANREKLEGGEFDSLSHELNVNTGQLETDQIGSFVDFWKQEIDGADCLMGSVRIFKRFPETCSSIIQLFESEDGLSASCEVLVTSYSEISDEGIRSIDYNDGNNPLIGLACVTTPAEKRSKGTLLVAEAYQKDMKSIQKGVDTMPKNSKDKVEIANKGVKVKYHGKVETSSLKFYEIEQKIYNLLNPVDPEYGHRDYNFMVHDLYNDQVVVEDWDNFDLYKIKYTINEDDTIALAPKDDWVKGSYGFIPDGVELNELLNSNEKAIKELQEKLDEVKGEKETMSKELEAKVTDLQEKLDKATTDLNAANELVVSEQEGKKAMEEKVAELNESIEELKTYKENFEKAEKEKQQKELSDKYSKLFDEKTFKSEDIQKAIETCDTVELNSKLVEQIAKQKQTETAQAKNDKTEVEIAASQGKDLLEGTVLQKYGFEG